MAAIPRGIQVINWKNADKSKSVRYRVRIQRADFSADRLFEDLDEAKGFLADSKSSGGRAKLSEDAARAEAMRLAIEETMNASTFGQLLDRYAAAYFPIDIDTAGTPTKVRANKALHSRLAGVKDTALPWIPTDDAATGMLGRVQRRIADEKPFGEFALRDITEETAAAFLRKRCEGRKASTVQRELNILRAFFNKLRFLDNAEWKRIDGRNPFSKPDTDAMRQRARIDARTARDEDEGRLDADAEKRLFEQLVASPNPEMLQIVALALETGMRRSELLALEWARVDLPHARMRLRDSKNGKPRGVPLTEAAVAILQSVARVKGRDRVFGYTEDGFASNWQHLKKRAKLGRFRFHDCRREFISRLVEQLAGSPVAAARVAAVEDMRYFERAYVEPARERQALKDGIRSEEDLRRAVGHANSQMTARYFAAKKRKTDK